MFASHPNFQLLSSILVLLGPVLVVFPIEISARKLDAIHSFFILHDLAQLDDPFDFFHSDRADTHCKHPQLVERKHGGGYYYALSLRMRESFR